MNFKKKITLNLDAVIAISILFAISISGSGFLLWQVKALSEENVRQKMQMTVDSLNLSSQQAYIDKLRKECGIESGE